MTVLAIENLSAMAEAPGGISALRRMILDLALSGRLTANAKGSRSGGNELPTGWQATTVGSIAECLDRLRRPITKQDRRAGSIPYYGASGIVDYVADHIFDEPLVLVGEDGAKWGAGEATAFRIEGKAWVNNHAHVLRPNRELVLDRFLELSLVAQDLSPFITGMTVPKLNQARLNLIPIVLPPISEQHSIVAKVDELMALCDRLEAEQADAEASHAKLVGALLASLTQARDAADFRARWQQLAEHFHTLFTTEASVDALKQTIVHLAVMGKLVAPVEGEVSASEFLAEIYAARAEYEAMPGQRSRLRVERGEPMAPPPYPAPAGWEWRNLGSLLLITGGVTLGRKLAGREVVSLPYLRVANVQRGFLVLDQVKEVEVPADEVEKYKLAPGDLLTTEGGDWDKVGRTAIWRGEIAQCLHQNHVFRSRPYTEKFSSRWVELYLNSLPARDYFAGSSKQTTNLASINMTQLRACAFPVPPLAEQQRIVATVDALLELCDQLKLRMVEASKHHEQVASAIVTQAAA